MCNENVYEVTPHIEYNVEDRVIANISGSKAKSDLILEGYDGHLYHACMYFRQKFIDELDLSQNIDHTELVLAAMKALDEGNKTVKTLRQDSKGVTFGASYGAYPKKIAASIGCSLKEGEQIFDAYHNKLYPEITAYKENYVIPTTKQNGEIHMLLGAMLRSDDVDGDIRSIFNATIQSFSVITLIALAQFQRLIDKHDMNDKVKITNTIYDAGYFEVDLDPEVIKWTNDTFTPLLKQQYLTHEDIPNDAACDLGFNLSDMVELSHNASIEEIEEVLNKLKD